MPVPKPCVGSRPPAEPLPPPAVGTSWVVASKRLRAAPTPKLKTQSAARSRGELQPPGTGLERVLVTPQVSQDPRFRWEGFFVPSLPPAGAAGPSRALLPAAACQVWQRPGSAAAAPQSPRCDGSSPPRPQSPRSPLFFVSSEPLGVFGVSPGAVVAPLWGPQGSVTATSQDVAWASSCCWLPAEFWGSACIQRMLLPS